MSLLTICFALFCQLKFHFFAKSIELDYYRDFITATGRTAAEVHNFLPVMLVLSKQLLERLSIKGQ